MPAALTQTSIVDSTGNKRTLDLHGSEGMVVTYARCCRPIPGDLIIGHLSSGRGLVIHTDDCNNMAEFRDSPDKCVMLGWAPNIQGEFLVELRVELENQRGMIATLATTITSTEASIEKISNEDRDAHLSIVNLSLSVRDRVHLARVMKTRTPASLPSAASSASRAAG